MLKTVISIAAASIKQEVVAASIQQESIQVYNIYADEGDVIDDPTELPSLQDCTPVAASVDAVASRHQLMSMGPIESVAGPLTGTTGRIQVLSPVGNFNTPEIQTRARAGEAVEEGLTMSGKRPMPSTSNTRAEKKRKRQLKFENTDKENHTLSGREIRGETNGRLAELLKQEAGMRVQHYRNLCQEDQERMASFREKESLEKKLLNIKIELARRQLENEGQF